MPPDLAEQAERAALERLNYCYWILDEDPEQYEGPVSEPIAPFCGCEVCVVREVLDASYQCLLELVKEQVA